MNPPRWTLIALCASALAASCATPDRSAAQGPATSSPADAPAPDGGAAAAPAFDAPGLSEGQRRELEAVFSDEFCYCGCPHTLGACLREHRECAHAKRAAELAAHHAAAGAPSPEIIDALSRHYRSFRERYALEPDPRLCKGPADAKVTLVEFSDFECPYCAIAAPILDKFVAGRPDVRLCYAPFPLPNHPNARPAAQAALFARDQGKFWPMHDALFAAGKLTRERILEAGVKVGLVRAKLEKALDSGAYADELERFRQAGLGARLQATPTVYVNGRPHALRLDPALLERSVQDELEWAANGGAWAEDPR